MGKIRKSRSESASSDWTWEETREIFTDWVADWGRTSGIKEKLRWKDFPLWWVSNLVQKDAFTDNQWYVELHKRLKYRKYERVGRGSRFLTIIKILASLFKYVVCWIYGKSLPDFSYQEDRFIYFHSLESNLIRFQGKIVDRMYEAAPLDDVYYGLRSAYALRLNFAREDLLRPLQWRKRVLGYVDQAERPLVFLDRYLSLRDIFHVHLSLVANYIKFLFLFLPFAKAGIRIGSAEVSDIVFKEIQNSFSAIMPWSLLYAVMFDRWLEERKSTEVIINYGETLAPIRAVNHIVNRHIFRPLWISIQHATAYRHKLGLYHRRAEFEETAEDRNFSSEPDFYFIHGKQFEEILSEYYPKERIRKIGCLKYDSLYRLKKRMQHEKGGKPSKTKALLLAPSIGDEEIIFRLFSGLGSLAGWKVILSKHPTVSEEHIAKILLDNDVKIPIEVNPDKSTKELIYGSDLVLTGFSGIALEAAYLGVPAIRVFDSEKPPAVEGESGLAYIEDQVGLMKLLKSHEHGGRNSTGAETIQNTIRRFFFRIDGKVSQRFWENLREILEKDVRFTRLMKKYAE
ncbi:hypothetical protein EHO61_12720 [Leptospira fluminis]|uniref:Uncharacterized protein n=1 Tax=Leptospira fluminis TaxID=2484979 RepID=A0A4R9GMH9_9LEPT|nr:hypothetical protein [Leptospira fluminis]TGK17269.1 hypothetical protein EHO61_12720 [Leptospira fluminis]